MKDQFNKETQLIKQVINKITENDGEIVYNRSSLIKAIFPENKIEQAVRTYFEITERHYQDAELSGGRRLTVFFGIDAAGT